MRRFLKLKALALLALTIFSVLAVLPSLVPAEQLPGWVTANFTRKFQLGLDLQGGLHLEYSVAVDEALEHKLDQIAAELEAGFRDKKELAVKVTREGMDTLVLTFPSPDDVAAATPDVMGVASDLMAELDPEDGAPGRDQGIIMLRVPEEKVAELRKDVVGTALDTVRNRVDAMGIAEPNIYPKNRQLVVELPGLSDTSKEIKAAAINEGQKLVDEMQAVGAPQVILEEVRGDPGAIELTAPGEDLRARLVTALERMILTERARPRSADEQTALMNAALDVSAPSHREAVRFRMASTFDVAGKRDEAAATATLNAGSWEPFLPQEQVGEALASWLSLQIVDMDAGDVDPAVLRLTMTEQGRETVLADASDFRRLLRIIERQAVLSMHLVDDWTEFKDGKPYLKALYEGGMVRKGMGISVNQLDDYGRENGVSVEDPFALYAKERETLEAFFRNLPPQWRLPSDMAIAYGPVTIRTRRDPSAPAEVLWRTYVIKSRAGVTGEHVVSASVGFDSQTGSPEVNVTLDRIGANLMEELSGANVGRRMAIILDDAVRSDPVFNERIGANFRITLGASPGQSPREAANDLTKVLKSGSLPARLQKEFEIRVGADLGEDSVKAGFWAFVYGLGAVVVFMLIYYRTSGIIAVLALAMNMIFILGAMALFQATLTLPGIAGIVLTIGMAVDANVIVFERIRDYLRDGYSARMAIESGYDRAFTTIVDSQLTTAIAGLVLWQYGSGPIRGFAVTLLIGIATSIFTGVFCSRLFFDFQANRRGFDKVSI
jgi:protein-export membrane protein SecD